MSTSIVDKRERSGDLEIDLVLGIEHKGALLTINDRATGVLFMTKVKSKMATHIQKATQCLLQDWKPLLHTITSDNGKEFAKHKDIGEQFNPNYALENLLQLEIASK